MRVFKTVLGVARHMSKLRREGKRIGLVPTMGALHEGHLSLVKRCAEENDVCVVSVFVNPTQFNNAEDLEKYPRTVEKDIEFLRQNSRCKFLFLPSVKEIYPEPDLRQFNFSPLDQVMEGPARPGHFNGVAQVVTRLFEIIEPHRAYFGEKDFQQLAIIRELVKRYPKYQDVEIIGCPIVREESGLALSSRNARLSDEEKNEAVNISKTLFASLDLMKSKSVGEVMDWVVSEINKHEKLNVEYFDIVDSLTLQKVNTWRDSDNITGCITVYCGEVRLIDNIQYKKA